MSSEQIQPGYKRTEVGVIPEDWEVKPLGLVISKGRLGGNYMNSGKSSEFPLMKMGNIGRGNFQVNDFQFITPGIQPDSEHKLNQGDVLLNTRNTLDLVGKVAIWRNELPVAYYNSNLMRLEFKEREIAANEYANAFLNCNGSVSRIRELATGTTSVAAIYTRDLVLLPFVVPPIPEQQSIARALSDMEALLAKLDQLIAKKRDLKQAAMQQLLTGQTRLPGFSGEWEVKRFDQICALRNDRVDPRIEGVQEFCVELEHIEPSSGRLLGSATTGAQASLKSKFKVGDVLFGKLRAYQRKHWLASRSGVCSTEIWVLISNQELSMADFLYHTVSTDEFIEAASTAYGTHMPRSDWSVVRQIQIALPGLDEQAAIATVLSDMDAEIAALETRRDKTRALKQGMMQELLTGRIRLV
jgi:type I restriction enzyme, S subunit